MPTHLETMHNPGDHAMGIELELVELVARQQHVTRSGREETPEVAAEMSELATEILDLQAELAETAALAAILGESAADHRTH